MEKNVCFLLSDTSRNSPPSPVADICTRDIGNTSYLVMLSWSPERGP